MLFRSGKVGASHVLAAMGAEPEVARGAIRISLGPATTRDDIEAFQGKTELAIDILRREYKDGDRWLVYCDAQEQLGDVVFVDLPKVGRKVAAHESVATVESVKAASDIFVPVSGEVVEVNAELSGDPALVNRAPESDGWMMKVKLSNETELTELMDKATYDKFVG